MIRQKIVISHFYGLIYKYITTSLFKHDKRLIITIFLAENSRGWACMWYEWLPEHPGFQQRKCGDINCSRKAVGHIHFSWISSNHQGSNQKTLHVCNECKKIFITEALSKY